MRDSGFLRDGHPNPVLRYNNQHGGIRVVTGTDTGEVPIFSGLAENELGFLAQRAAPRHYSAGEIIFGEGEPCSGLYVVESGHVRIFKSSASGREQVLSIDGPPGWPSPDGAASRSLLRSYVSHVPGPLCLR